MSVKATIVVLTIIAILMATLAVFFSMPMPSRINETNANRIKAGMSFADAEKILGPPRDEMDEFPDDRYPDSVFVRIGEFYNRTRSLKWVSESTTVRLSCDRLTGEIVSVTVERTDAEPKSSGAYLWWRVRRMFGQGVREFEPVVFPRPALWEIRRDPKPPTPK